MNMQVIDARLEPHFSVSYFFLQPRSIDPGLFCRKLSESSAKSINFAKKSRKLRAVSLGDKSWEVYKNRNLIQLKGNINHTWQAMYFICGEGGKGKV